MPQNILCLSLGGKEMWGQLMTSVLYVLSPEKAHS